MLTVSWPPRAAPVTPGEYSPTIDDAETPPAVGAIADPITSSESMAATHRLMPSLGAPTDGERKARSSRPTQSRRAPAGYGAAKCAATLATDRATLARCPFGNPIHRSAIGTRAVDWS